MQEILLEEFDCSKSFKIKLVLDVGLFIYFLGTFIYSIVRFAVNQDPMVYNIVCNVVSFIGLIIASCALAYTLYKHCTIELHRGIRVHPENYEQDEDFDTCTLKELALDIFKESLIYPSVICILYGFINERSWQFDNALGGINFLMFLFSLCYDALYIRLKYVWTMQKVISSLCCESDEIKCKCCLSLFSLIPHLFLFILTHWLTLAIIGTRIYVDNFSTEIDLGSGSETSDYPLQSIYADNFTEGNVSETGGYKITPYTGYMISCGIYLPIASVIVFFILSRGWFSDDVDSTCEEIFHFLRDPPAYIATIFLMVPFVAFCVGIYLPDYDSSVFEVDANARDAVEILGMAFIITFLLFNIKATVLFAIIIVIVGIIVVILCLIIIVGLLYIPCCLCGAITHHDNNDNDNSVGTTATVLAVSVFQT